MIKVLVVDDSALVRQLLSHMLSQAPDIKVVGSAEDPYQAREMIKSLNPDVLTLDVEMPKMDGISFLRNLMKLRPMPVIMISTLTEKGAAVTLEALSLGAIDYIAKPKSDLSNKLLAYQDDLIAKIRLAARCNVRPSSIIPPQPAASTTGEKHKLKSRLIAIGASTGGTEAIAQIIAQLPDNFPPSSLPSIFPQLLALPLPDVWMVSQQ